VGRQADHTIANLATAKAVASSCLEKTKAILRMAFVIETQPPLG